MTASILLFIVIFVFFITIYAQLIKYIVPINILPFSMILSLLFYFLMYAMVQGALTYGVFFTLKNEKVLVRDCFKAGFKRVIPVFLTSLLAGVSIAIGNMFFVIPGIILMCGWLVATPACVVESLGPIQSLKRSYSLTQGYKARIFGMMVLVGFISALLFILLALVNAIIAEKLNTFLFVIIYILMSFNYLFLYIYMQFMYAVLYYELRSMKEGVALNKLVTVFE